MRRVVFTILAPILLMSACTRQSADISQNAPSRSTTAPSALPQESKEERSATMNPVAPPGGSAGPQPAVELSEYSIRMPQTLPAGTHSFRIVNAGKELHSFEVEGGGVHARLPADLPRGNTASLDVNLKPGTYTVYCPVKDHRQKGMTTTITVHQ